MNVAELIYQIKKRPGMYVGCIQLEPVIHFINGFMLSNAVANRMDDVEKKFNAEFNDWVKNTLEKKYNVTLEEHRNYMFYITKVSQNAEEELRTFFELCEDFFKEVHQNM